MMMRAQGCAAREASDMAKTASGATMQAAATFLEGLDGASALSDALACFDSIDAAGEALAAAACEQGEALGVDVARAWLRGLVWQRALELRAGADELEPDELCRIMRLLRA